MLRSVWTSALASSEKVWCRPFFPCANPHVPLSEATASQVEASVQPVALIVEAGQAARGTFANHELWYYST